MGKKSTGPMQSRRQWKQWREPEARAALSSWRGSGLSMARFCAREGYSVTRLRYWSERLSEEKESCSLVSFVPIPLSAIQQTRWIEIERSGVVLRVREDLDVAHVAGLVAALSTSGSSC